MSRCVVCLCGLLRLEDEPCLICEGDDFSEDDMLEGLREYAGDLDDTKRQQIERVIEAQERTH